MARLELHPLPGAKRAAEVADLAARLHGQRRRVVIWVSDEGRARILDDFLWTSDKLSFLPHAVWVEGVDVAEGCGRERHAGAGRPPPVIY